MEKRGLSDVITTVLLILIAIVAVIILAAFIWPALKSSSEQTSANQASISTNFLIERIIYYNATEKQINFTLKREAGAGQANISGFMVSLEDINRNTKVYRVNITLVELESRNIGIHYNDSNLGNLSSIYVTPIIKSASGKEIIGATSASSSISGGGGGGGESGGPTGCNPGTTVCGSWNLCNNGTQTRSCSDGCTTITQTQACGSVSSSELTISLVSPTPSNNYQQIVSSFIVNFTGFANNNLSSGWIMFNGTNYSVSCIGNEEYYCLYTFSSLSVGTYNYRAYVNDSLGNTNVTEQRNIIIQSATQPSVSIISPTNGQKLVSSSVNISFTTTNSNYCWWNINNGVNNSVSCVSGSGNFTSNVIAGTNTINVYSNDSSNNIATASVSFDIDNLSPVVSIISPSSDGLWFDNQISIVSTETDTNLQSCWWSINNGVTNNSFNCNSAITGQTWNEGTNTITVFANDTFGNLGIATRQFNIDMVNPQLSIISPTQNQVFSKASVNITYSFNEAHPNTCWWNSTFDGGVTHLISSCGTNITGQTWNEGSNTVSIFITDLAGHLNYSSVTFSVDSNMPQISNLVTSIQSPAIYSKGTSYQFNATVTDTNLDTVLIEFNGINFTTTRTGNVNSFIVTDLGAGNYTYKWIVNDTFGNQNVTSKQNYTINKANPTTGMGILGTTTIGYGASSNFVGSESNNGDSNCGYILSPNNAIFGVGTTVFNYSTAGCTNYTAGSVTKGLTVNQATAQTSLVFDKTTPQSFGTPINVSCSIVNGQGSVVLYRDGVDRTSENNQLIALTVGTHNYNCTLVANQNYTYAENTSMFVINQASTTTTLTVNPSSPTIYGSLSNFSCSNTKLPTVLLINGIDKTSENNVNLLRAAGSYTINCTAFGNQNYTGDSKQINYLINKNAGVVFTYLNNSRSNINVNIGNSIWLNGTLQTGVGAISFYNSGNLINSGNPKLSNFTVFNTPGSYNVTTYYVGNENYTSAFETFFVNVIDNLPPLISNLVTSPVSPVTYTSGAVYTFNATVSDANIDTVLIEFNGVNFTSAKTGNVYSFVRNGLAAGIYNYKWIVNDSFGNQNVTSIQAYTVNKANPTSGMFISGTTPINYGLSSDFVGSHTNSGDSDCVYSLSPNNAIYGVNTVVFNYSTAGCTNYTAGSITKNLIVNAGSAQVSLSFDKTSAQNYGTAINASCRVVTGIGSVVLYRDGIDRTSENNKLIVLNAGAHNYNCTLVANQNYTYTESTNTFTINKVNGVVFTYLNNSRNSLTINSGNSIWLNGTLQTGVGAISLYNNGNLINSGNSPLSNFTLFSSLGSYNITTYYSGNENYTSAFETFFVGVIDSSLPTVHLVSPNNNFVTNILAQNFNCSIADNVGVSNISLYIWNSTKDKIFSNTAPISGTSNSKMFAFNFLSSGVYQWGCLGYDTSSNGVWDVEGNYTITIDNIKPQISFINSTEGSGVYLNRSNINLNTSASDSVSGLKNITEFIYNSTGLVTIGNSLSSPFYNSFANLPDGIYWFNATAYDNAGNFNSTGTRNVTIDSTAPQVSYVLPTPNDSAKISVNSFVINLSVIESNFANITYNLYNSTSLVNKTTFNLPVYSVTISNLPDGNYQYNVTLVDLAGNRNIVATRTLRIDTTNPNAVLGSPANNTVTSNTATNFTVTITDNLGLSNATLRITNSTGGIVAQVTTAVGGALNVVVGTVVNLADGVYNWFYTVYDNVGNIFATQNRTLTVSTLPYATRSFSVGSYAPGANFTVNINAYSGVGSYIVEECLPVGWTASSISDGGSFISSQSCPLGGSGPYVTWPIFNSGTSKTLAYQAISPSGSSGVQTFNGQMTYGGGDTITVGGTLNINSSIQATRSFSVGSYTSGSPFTVSVYASSSIGSYIVEDCLPIGWTASSISDGGSYFSSGCEGGINPYVSWPIFSNGTSMALTYQVLPSGSGIKTFTGQIGYGFGNTISFGGTGSINNT